MTRKIFIFGDSHGQDNFRNWQMDGVCNKAEASITMHRVGRDKLAYIDWRNLNLCNTDNVVFIYQFGEVDCRCHVGKQVQLGRNAENVIYELVSNYLDSININLENNLNDEIKIIVCCVPPPMEKNYYEAIHGPIQHEFPFVGTDEERINYTLMLNKLLKHEAMQKGFYFLDYYDHYKNEAGTLNPKLSDNVVHISQNQYILKKIEEIL